jgi:hypothetical protein
MDIFNILPLNIYYTIESEGDIEGDMDEFARNAHVTLNDPRGWSLGGRIKFINYSSPWDPFSIPPPEKRQLRIILASPDVVKGIPGCSGYLSCQFENCVYINDHRWCYGSPNRPGLTDNPLAEYRQYVLNHEVGHWFGLEHVILECSPNNASSPNPTIAPVMKQQSRGLHNCIPTTWPLDFEKCEVMRLLGWKPTYCRDKSYPGIITSITQSAKYWLTNLWKH